MGLIPGRFFFLIFEFESGSRGLPVICCEGGYGNQFFAEVRILIVLRLLVPSESLASSFSDFWLPWRQAWKLVDSRRGADPDTPGCSDIQGPFVRA